MRISALLAITLGLWLFVSDVAAAQNPQASSEASAQAANAVPGFKEHYPRYQLVAGDTIEVTFEYSPEFNQTLTIQPDGFVTLRDVGDVHVEGKTVPEVTAAMRNAYSKILSDPSIAVVVKDFEKPYFTASGQVGRPGHYNLHGQTTVTEALAMAGGLTEKSKHSQVVLFRRVDSQWTEAKVLDVKKMLSAKNLQEDLIVHPGDMLFVPQNRLSKISRFIPNSGVTAYVNPQTF
jgi:polysaccharide biosynthesis/export protein